MTRTLKTLFSLTALLALCAIIYRLLLHRHCRRFVPAAARRDAATEAL